MFYLTTYEIHMHSSVLIFKTQTYKFENPSAKSITI